MAVDKGFHQFARHAQALGPHQSAARYPPVGDYPYTREVAMEAVRLARELFDFVSQKIEQRKQRGLL
jgi:HEPN domain-containing protein